MTPVATIRADLVKLLHTASASAKICTVTHRPPRIVFQEPPWTRIV